MPTILGSQLWLRVWDDDETLAGQIDDMLACGLELARVFLPWNQLEPADDQWDFDLFDRFFRLCEQKGMKVAPTLTCAMGTPRWYARMLNGSAPTLSQEAELDTLRVRHAAKIADRYGGSSAMSCWILANEPILHLPLTDATIAGFRKYLAVRHADPVAFSRLYGVSFIEEIGGTAPDGSPTLGLNGRWDFAGKVDWAGFETETLIRRLTLVGSAVKGADPNHPTTINPDGITVASPYSGGRDLWRFGQAVDFLGFSCHVSWHSTRFASDRIHQSVGMFCDMVRSATADPDGAFHVTELQAGTNYFSGNRPMCPTPADIRHWLFEALGAGATGIVYWLFNARDHGFEGLEWGLNGQDGRPSGRTRATRAVYDALHAGEAQLAFAPNPPDVYLLHDTDSMVLGEIEAEIAHGSADKTDPRTPMLIADALCGAYCMLRDMGYAVGFVSPEHVKTLQDDATLIAPNTYAMRHASVAAVADFAVRGGRVIADGLFAVKDEYGDAGIAARPLLKALFGGILEDFGVELHAIAMRTPAGDLPGFYLQGMFEESEGRAVVARWPDGSAAAIRFGENLYIGTQFFQGYFAREGDDPAARAFLAPYLPKRKIPYLNNPSSMLSMRARGGALMIANRGGDCAADIALDTGDSLTDALSGEPLPNPLPLKQDDIRLLTIARGGL